MVPLADRDTCGDAPRPGGGRPAARDRARPARTTHSVVVRPDGPVSYDASRVRRRRRLESIRGLFGNACAVTEWAQGLGTITRIAVPVVSIS